MLDQEYPEAALVSEWSNPQQAINGGGFHMDFYLDHWHNGYNTLYVIMKQVGKITASS